MYVRDLMQSEVVTLNAADTLDLADDIMRLGRIRHMPVVSPHDKLAGILSQRDLFRAAISSVLELRPAAEREWLAKIPVREVMTTRVVTIAPTATVREAVKTMLDKRIGCLPVIENDTLVGLLSESDCMRYLARLLDIADTKQGLPELPQPD
jgi:CBS domain-containing protein